MYPQFDYRGSAEMDRNYRIDADNAEANRAAAVDTYRQMQTMACMRAGAHPVKRLPAGIDQRFIEGGHDA